MRSIGEENSPKLTWFHKLIPVVLWPSWQQRKRILRFEAWVAVVAIYVLLVAAYFWPQNYRTTASGYVLISWMLFLVRVLQFHLGLLLIVVLCAGLMLRERRLIAAALLPLIFVFAPIMWSLRPRPQPAAPPRALRVMKANLLVSNPDTSNLIKQIRDAQPDVLLLQEYAAHWHAALEPVLSGAFPYSSYTIREDSFGTAIYSRRPFVGRVIQNIPLGHSLVPQTRAVVNFNGRDVAFYNIHLLPPFQLSYARETRLQFADLLDVLKEEKLPFVLAGDFNFNETTPQHAAIRRIGGRDTQDLMGKGRGATWPVNSFLRYLPGLRLDHMYLSGPLDAISVRRDAPNGSDHRPIIADLILKQN